MRIVCPRLAWHDAFNPDTSAPDFATRAAGVGVQFSARGADNKIVIHVELGFIQRAVSLVRDRDYLAYCWGMIAYAPHGVATESEFSALHGHMRTAFYAKLPPNSELLKWKYHATFERKLKLLIKIAVIDAGADDMRMVDDGSNDPIIRAPRRLNADLAALIGVSERAYKAVAHRYYKFFKHLCEDLPSRALEPVTDELYRLWRKRGPDERTQRANLLLNSVAAMPFPAPPPRADDVYRELAEALRHEFEEPTVAEAALPVARILGTLRLKK